MAIRTISIPVAEIIEGGSKSEFYGDLRKSLDTSVRIANYCISECVKQDDFTNDKCGKIYTYPHISKLAPGCTVLASSIARNVEKSYKSDRWGVIRGKRSIRTFRSYPWPLLNNKSHSTIKLAKCDEWIEAKVKLLGGWWSVRLRAGSNYRDQILGLTRAIESERYGDSKIWIDCSGVAVIGVSCDVKASERSDLRGTLFVSTAIDSFVKMTSSRSDTAFVINADECRQWQAWASRRMQRLRQDRKSGVDRRRIQEQIDIVTRKNRHRFNTLCHEVSSSIVKRAIQKRFAEIKLDFTVKSYAKNFPWFKLTSMITYKANDAGIQVVNSTQTVTAPDLEQPHVYFAYDPWACRVKIGRTFGGDSRISEYNTFCPDAIILAIDNQPKSKLVAREKHFHACFANHRVTGKGKKGNEVFDAKPVIDWLRAVGWLGNAGNLSQIMQFLEVAV